MSDASPRLIAPRGLALAFALVIAAFCCRADNSLMLMLDMQGVLPPFLGALGAGALLGCLALFAGPVGTRRSRVIWASAGTACIVAGLSVAGFVQTLPAACLPAGGALIGFGLALALCQWWAAFAVLPSGALLATASVAFLLASAIWYVLRHVGSFPVTCFCLVVCALCSGLLFLLSLAATENDVESDAGDAREPEPAVPIANARYGKVAAAAAVGLLFNFFTLGLTYWPVAAGLSTTSVNCKPLSYLLIVVVLALLARRAPFEGRNAVSFAHVALPIAAAIVLASPFVELIVDLGPVPVFTSLTYLGIALFNVLGFALPLSAVREAGRPVMRAAAVYLAACALAVIAGMLVFRALGQSAQVVSLCIMAAYLAGLAIASVRRPYDRGPHAASSDDGLSANTAVPFDARAAACEHVAASYALSPREAEILQFLARGHGAKYIADRLCISADTVRTHCKRIYEKTGVHAKDELVELVEHAE